MYFYAEETPYQKGKFLIRSNFDKLPLKYTTGSYNIIEARLLGLTYAQYLRYCRDFHSATILGKNCLYPVPYFTQGTELNSLLKILNERAKKALKEKENE